MSVLINFKICDNVKECSGIEVCPIGALSWDDKKKTIVIDNSKCISCGQCAKACPMEAIKVAKTDDEYERIKEEIDNDPRTVEELFVDRYGASPISDFSMIKYAGLDKQTDTDNIVLIEVYNDNSIECLAKSIPAEDLKKSLGSNVWYFKMKNNDEVEKRYGITRLPALLIFRKSELLGKVEGYYSLEEKDKLIEEVNKIKRRNLFRSFLSGVLKKHI